MTRVLLTLGIIFAIAAFYALMRAGWSRRVAMQQGIARPHEMFEEPTIAGPWSGYFIGTTFAGRWLDRVDAHTLGARSVVELSLTSSGINVQRERELSFGIPRDTLLSVRADKAIAGRAYESAGLIIITFKLGEQDVECGVRIPSTSEHLAVLTALTSEVSA